MGEHRVSVIEGIVQRVEDRIAEWRSHDAALKAEAVASEAFADALQGFTPGRDRLLSVIPAREGGGGMGLRGSWLVLEKG
jgi:hypothetical protein